LALIDGVQPFVDVPAVQYGCGFCAPASKVSVEIASATDVTFFMVLRA
jgi:hypothetical protein